MSNLIKTIQVTEEWHHNFEPRIHEVSVCLPYDSQDQPVEGEIAFFNVYTVQRLYGGSEEGGWWYNWTHLEFTVPFIFSRDTTSLMIEAHLSKIKELPYGDIYSVKGGQDAFILIEKSAGASASTEHPSYE